MSEEIEGHVLARFDVVKKIGSGAYGHVWKVTDRKSKRVKALKKNFDAFNNSTDAQRTYRQIMFLMEVSHPNVIRLEEVIRAENNRDIYIVFQHMDIDLYTLVREDILAERHRKYIFYQMAKALFYLHSAGLIHRDVKPSNVLVNENCDAKLCDFGLVRSIDDAQDQQEILTEYIATRWYRAPEILLGSRRYSKAIDVWSMGCMLAEMIRGKPLFPGTSTINQLEKVLQWTGSPSEQEVKSLRLNTGQEVFKLLGKVKKCSRRELVPAANDDCLDLISRLLEFDPDKRLSIEEVLRHPYLSEFYSKKEVVSSPGMLRVPIDDNQRLSLKDYRSTIYEEIRKRSKGSVDPANTTLYRIKQNIRKTLPKKAEGQHRVQSVEDEVPPKRSFPHKEPVTLGKGRNVRTIEKEWDPVQTKKSVVHRERDRFIYTKYDNDWVKKKRSTTEASSTKKKPIRLAPSPNEARYRMH